MSTREVFSTVYRTALAVTIYFAMVYLPVGLA
jgi:hypothetical protein